MPSGGSFRRTGVAVGLLCASGACVSPARVQFAPDVGAAAPGAAATVQVAGSEGASVVASPHATVLLGQPARADTGRDGRIPNDTVRDGPIPDDTVRGVASPAAPPPDSQVAPATAADDLVALPPLPTWDLAVESNASRARVTYFVNVFTGRLREAFQKAMSRQTMFAPLIEARLRAAGLPLDLTYLAFVESYYDPQAYSRAAAVGMWQFMTRTARGVGLRVDWWVDERRDPVRSTEGAIRLLSSLNDEFGSLFLAAAAYNGGSGRVTRGLARFAARLDGIEGDDRFFALSDTRYLRAETRDYIPKIIAAALVAKQPDRYGLTVDSLPPFVFDSVLVPGGTPLAAVAAAAPAPVDSVRSLNPHVLRGMVPEGDSMWVRVPVGTADGFVDRFGMLDSAALVAVTRVKSKKGESMASIARRHGLTSKQLGWFNPKAARLKSGNLVAGQTILVPSRAVVAAARDVPNPAIERYPRRAR